MKWFSRDQRYRRPERGSMRWQLARLLDRFSRFPSSAFVEGLLVALLTARREVPQNEWAPLVLGDDPLEGDVADPTIKLVMLAWEEIHEAMLSDPGSCVPPPKTKQRLEWCRGFVAGMKMSKEPPPESKLALSIVISMDVLSGGFPFEELELEVEQAEKEWRRGMEENLPDLVLTVVAEISKKALEKTPKKKRRSRRKRKARARR